MLFAVTGFMCVFVQGVRGGKVIPLKETVNRAVEQAPCVERVFMYALGCVCLIDVHSYVLCSGTPARVGNHRT